MPEKEEAKQNANQSVALDEKDEAQQTPSAQEKSETETKQDVEVKRAEFQEVAQSPGGGEKPGLDLLLDVSLPVAVELGRTSMTVKEVLSIGEGSVIELDRAAGEPVDVLVSGKVLGRGEVVVVDDRFGVRITELVSRVEGMPEK